jgi:hypothetical protein
MNEVITSSIAIALLLIVLCFAVWTVRKDQKRLRKADLEYLEIKKAEVKSEAPPKPKTHWSIHPLFGLPDPRVVPPPSPEIMQTKISSEPPKKS